MPSSRANSTTGSPDDLRAIKSRLREAFPRLRETYAVERLAVHGSHLRGEADAESDIDVLVDFQDSEAGRQVSLLDFIALKKELEDVLGMPVDLGERRALRGTVGEKIRQEAEPI